MKRLIGCVLTNCSNYKKNEQVSNNFETKAYKSRFFKYTLNIRNPITNFKTNSYSCRLLKYKLE